MEIKELMEKAKEFTSRKNTITLKRYNEIKKEWNQIVTKRISGEITDEEALKIHLELKKEQEEAEIRFDNEEDFKNFSNLLIGVGISLSNILEQVEHEIEHSKPFKEVSINSHFGWHIFPEPCEIEGIKAKRFQPFHQPFGEKYDALPPFEKDKLQYKSLKVVSSPSDRDKEALKILEERHGDKIKEQ